MNRRAFLAAATAALPAALASCAAGANAPASGDADGQTFEVTRTEAEWRKLLTPDQFHILREHGTEAAGSSPLNKEQRAGTFFCAGCDLPVYSSTTKFESGTGWPSFTAPIPAAVRTKEDRGFLGTRTEVHCRRCGGHLGHVFDDGPPPTGKRYCMNGVAMKFAAA